MASLKDTLRLVHEELASRYGKLEIVSVQGVPKGQRVRFVDQGKPVQCVIKVSSAQSHGRISFQLLPDGTFGGGLLDSDLVAVVGPSDPNDQGLVLSMYDQPTLLEAFTANREALKQSGNSQGGQSWLAPFHEEGRGFRGVGDGFQSKALWSEPLAPASPDSPPPQRTFNSSVERRPDTAETIAEVMASARERIAQIAGVRADAVKLELKLEY